jgi:uncharacterized protein YkwD
MAFKGWGILFPSNPEEAKTTSEASSIPTTEGPITVVPTIPSPPSWDNKEIEKEAFELVNEARREGGLRPLTLDPLLQGLAREHCKYMKNLGCNSHQGFQERADAISAARGSSWVAENVVVGYYSAESVVNSWLNSPPHALNMLDPNVEWAGLAFIDGAACLIVCD